jgi:hypothetical protein
MDEIYADWRQPPDGELTPQEIAARAAIEREIHLRKKRNERGPAVWPPVEPDEIRLKDLRVDED